MSSRTAKTRQLLAIAALACVVGFTATHETSGADKAGGVAPAPRVLRLGTPWTPDNPDAFTLEDFAKQVEERADGRLKVQIVYQASGGATDDREARIGRLVQHAQLDLGYVDARAWDALGVRSLQALAAPFLIRDDAALVGVVKSPLADEMLGGLRQLGVTGLALMPYLLNHPVALQRPLVSPADFAGAHLAAFPSRATDLLVRTLGATPVHMDPVGGPGTIPPAASDGQIHMIFGAVPHGILTANVNLPPDVKTLVINTAALDSLAPGERRAMLDSARAVGASYLPPDRFSEAEIIEAACTKPAAEAPWARIVIASRSQIAALARTTQPIYTQLEQDPQTRTLIARIRKLEASLPATPPLRIPAAGCRPPAHRPAAGEPRPANLINGTYRYIITKDDARSHGAESDRNPAGLARFPQCFSVTLRDGRWLMTSCSGASDASTGTYALAGDRVTFDWPAVGSRLTFTLSIARDRSLRLEPVLPMEQGDQFVWSTEPWRRIGPPVRTIP
jgi:TRAP-type C4-dicarboxylate transport system substrate-binding protein